MAPAASTLVKSVLVSLATLLVVLVSAVEGYNGRHAAAHSAVARRSRLGKTRHVHHRRTATPHRYVLAEKSNRTASGAKNRSVPATSNATSPTQVPPAAPSKHHRSHKHRVRNWIIGFVVGSLVGVISGLVLFRLTLNCIRGRYRSRSGVTIFTPKLIRRAEHLAFLEKEDGLASLAVIGCGGCSEVYKAQLPVEREGEEPRFIAIKKIKKSRTATPPFPQQPERRGEPAASWTSGPGRSRELEIESSKGKALVRPCLFRWLEARAFDFRVGHASVIRPRPAPARWGVCRTPA